MTGAHLTQHTSVFMWADDANRVCPATGQSSTRAAVAARGRNKPHTQHIHRGRHCEVPNTLRETHIPIHNKTAEIQGKVVASGEEQHQRHTSYERGCSLQVLIEIAHGPALDRASMRARAFTGAHAVKSNPRKRHIGGGRWYRESGR